MFKILIFFSRYTNTHTQTYCTHIAHILLCRKRYRIGLCHFLTESSQGSVANSQMSKDV